MTACFVVPRVLQPWVSACRIRLAKATPIVSLKSKHKWDSFLRLHSEEPSDGDGLVIFGLETQTSKDAAPQIGPHWISVQQPQLSEADAGDSSSLLIGLYHKMWYPYPSLHFMCHGLISHVFTWIGLVTDNLFIQPSRDGSPSLYVFILRINMGDNIVWDPMTNSYWLAWTLGQSLFGNAVCGVPCRNISTLCNCHEFKAFTTRKIGDRWFLFRAVISVSFTPSPRFLLSLVSISFYLSSSINYMECYCLFPPQTKLRVAAVSVGAWKENPLISSRSAWVNNRK